MFLTSFKNAPADELSSPVPTYLLGGRSGGILWSESVEYSLEKPDEPTRVLSELFDESIGLSERLRTFEAHYSKLDTTGVPLLCLATMVLMFAHPAEYVI